MKHYIDFLKMNQMTFLILKTWSTRIIMIFDRPIQKSIEYGRYYLWINYLVGYDIFFINHLVLFYLHLQWYYWIYKEIDNAIHWQFTFKIKLSKHWNKIHAHIHVYMFNVNQKQNQSQCNIWYTIKIYKQDVDDLIL